MMIASINRQSSLIGSQNNAHSEPSSEQSHFTKILFEFEDEVEDLEKINHKKGLESQVKIEDLAKQVNAEVIHL